MVAMVSKEGELTTFVAEGEMSSDEIFAAFTHFLEGGATPFALWDLSRASLAELKAESIRVLARRMAHAAKGRRPRGRTALVCARPVDFGVAHILAAYLSGEDYPVDVATFTSMDSAKAWLNRAVVR
jgi:hypothetical protein